MAAPPSNSRRRRRETLLIDKVILESAREHQVTKLCRESADRY